MLRRRWLPIIACVAFGAAVFACAADEDLNPQPLPPGGGTGEDRGTSGSTVSSSGETSPAIPGGGSSGFSSSGGSSGGGSSSGFNSAPDAGESPDADAGDQ